MQVKPSMIPDNFAVSLPIPTILAFARHIKSSFMQISIMAMYRKSPATMAFTVPLNDEVSSLSLILMPIKIPIGVLHAKGTAADNNDFTFSKFAALIVVPNANPANTL